MLAGFAMLFPERPLTFLVLFILPLTIRAKFLLLIFAGLAAFGIIFPAGNLADAAHLGGMLAGVVYVRYAVNWHWRWPQLRRPRPAAPRRLVKVSSGSSAAWGRARSADDLPAEEFLSKEVDPILDKISAHGIQSLTERERRILEAAREKMGNR